MLLLEAKPSPHSLIFYSLLVIGGLFYNLSLEHGIDVDWIHRKLFYLSSMLLLSSSSFLAAAAMLLYYTTFPTLLKLSNFFIMLLWISILFIQDTGNTIQYHGGYNILCFLIVTVPALLLMLFIRAIIRAGVPVKFKHFVYAISAFSIILGLRLLWVRDDWVKGLSGSEYQGSLPQCDIPAPSYNWGEVPPYRGINFWTGSTTCPEQKQLATYDKRTGKLEINEKICGTNAIVQILPKTDNFTFEEKIDANFQKTILSRMQEIPVSNPMYINEEAVLVNCGESSNLFVRNVKKQIQARKNSQKLSVLIIYLDAVSRRHFYRRFPKTVKLLEDINNGNTHKAFQFFKYNSVGMITVKNAPGLFTGATFHQSWVQPQSIDPIWQKYQNSSYVTAVIDNSCLDWSARYQGKLSTVDHQFVAPFCLEESHPSGDPHSGLNGPFSIRRRCMRGKYVHSYVFDYLRQFWDNYAGFPRFALAMFNEGHEGTGDVIGLVDDDLYEFLYGEYESGGFDNTAIFFLADHGLHMGPFYMFGTYSAKLENHLPLLNAVFPRKFIDENPKVEEALMFNKDQMFTGIDIFETLAHISNYPIKPEPVSEGSSLLEPLTRGNSCEDAHIPEDFCVCK